MKSFQEMLKKNIIFIAFFVCFAALLALTAGSSGLPEQFQEEFLTRPVLTDPPPTATVHFSANAPASLKPVLTWTKTENAVAYELELLHELPAELIAEDTSPEAFYTNRNIYVTGFNADLTEDNLEKNRFYWRVRGLDLDGEPVSPFSVPERVYVSHELNTTLMPRPTSIFNEARGSVLLYPVYAWIPVSGAASYEVEILSEPRENPNGIAPSLHRIDMLTSTTFDRYDDKPRISNHPFYWRVRALDEEGGPLGVYSDAQAFENNPDADYIVATYGDSVTYGGGSISYSPADWEYSYQHYLSFPTINLGRSGDTSRTMLDRFDRDVLPFHPRYLIILAGTNSLRGGVPAKDVIADIQAMQKKSLENGIKPVLLTLPGVNPANIRRAFNQPTTSDWQKQILLVNQYIRTQIHIDTASRVDDDNGLLPTAMALDGLHMGMEGKRRIAEAINQYWDWITDLPDEAWQQ